MTKVRKLSRMLIMKDLLTLTNRHAVFFEVFVSVAVVPLEADDLGKNPHPRSVYVILYMSSCYGHKRVDSSARHLCRSNHRKERRACAEENGGEEECAGEMFCLGHAVVFSSIDLEYPISRTHSERLRVILRHHGDGRPSIRPLSRRQAFRMHGRDDCENRTYWHSGSRDPGESFFLAQEGQRSHPRLRHEPRDSRGLSDQHQARIL